MKLWTLNKVTVTFCDPTNHSLNGPEHKKLLTCFCRFHPHSAQTNESDQSISVSQSSFFLFYFTSIWIQVLLWVVWMLVYHWRGWVKESRAIFHPRSVPELRPLLKRESEFRGGDRSSERSDAWAFSCCGGRAPLQSSSGYIYFHLNHLHNSAAITAPRHSRKYHIHNTKYESFSIRKLGFFSSPIHSQYMTQKSNF